MTTDDAETLKLALAAIDDALRMPGFAERLPMHEWMKIGRVLATLILDECAGGSTPPIRAETGVVQFEGDGRGIYLRGDDALAVSPRAGRAVRASRPVFLPDPGSDRAAPPMRPAGESAGAVGAAAGSRKGGGELMTPEEVKAALDELVEMGELLVFYDPESGEDYYLAATEVQQ